jgi:hypothetical protein
MNDQAWPADIDDTNGMQPPSGRIEPATVLAAVNAKPCGCLRQH